MKTCIETYISYTCVYSMLGKALIRHHHHCTGYIEFVLCVRACVTYEREVTGKPFDPRRKKAFFSASVDLDVTTARWPTDMDSYGPSRD